MGGGIGSMQGSTALIEGNTCFENFHAGIGCNASSPVVKSNVCQGNIRAGIGISEGSSPTVTGNRCFKDRRAGIGVTGGSEATIKDNELAREGGMPPMIAVLDGSRAIVTGNTIRGGGVAGILVKGKGEIRGNHFIGNGPTAKPPADNAIWAQAGIEVTCIGNRIEAWKQTIAAAKDAKITAADKELVADSSGSAPARPR